MCNILKISATSWGEVVPSFSLKAKDAMSSKADVSKSVLILMGCWVANLLTSDLTCSLIFARKLWRAYSELTNTKSCHMIETYQSQKLPCPKRLAGDHVLSDLEYDEY